MRLCLLAAFVFMIPSLALAAEAGNFTNLHFDPGHGTQVEYVAGDGQSYLWYPGNRRVLTGRWKQDGSEMCFAYGENTYNPVTGTRGGAWECEPFKAYASGIVERMEGDVFGLAQTSRIPFTLSPKVTTLSELLSER